MLLAERIVVFGLGLLFEHSHAGPVGHGVVHVRYQHERLSHKRCRHERLIDRCRRPERGRLVERSARR